MNIRSAIKTLDQAISNPNHGLPKDIFLFVSRLTPMVNVDLLVKDEKGRMLLSWRDDKFNGKGWHIPGGIVRFKETLEQRIQKVAKEEIGVKIKFDPAPISVNQIICKQNERGHFISMLFKCFLSSRFIPKNIGLSKRSVGYLQWHQSCPRNLIKVHQIYQKFLTKKA